MWFVWLVNIFYICCNSLNRKWKFNSYHIFPQLSNYFQIVFGKMYNFKKKTCYICHWTAVWTSSAMQKLYLWTSETTAAHIPKISSSFDILHFLSSYLLFFFVGRVCNVRESLNYNSIETFSRGRSAKWVFRWLWKLPALCRSCFIHVEVS